MSAVIEVRTYRAKPGMREPLLELLRSRGFPLHRQLGMRILGPFPSQEDDVTFVWLRAFPDEASRAPLKAAFYQASEWLEELEALILPMLDHYGAVITQDSDDVWSRWPAEKPAEQLARPESARTMIQPTIHRMLFAVRLKRGGPWDWSRELREQDSWDEHARFMDALVAEGFIVLGGPVVGEREILYAIAAESEDAIRARLAQDNWAQNGMLTITSIERWKILLNGRTA